MLEASEKKKPKALLILNLLYLVREIEVEALLDASAATHRWIHLTFIHFYFIYILIFHFAWWHCCDRGWKWESRLRHWCDSGAGDGGRTDWGNYVRVRVWLSEGWTGPFFSKQEAASLCLERRGISLRKTQMRSLVGTDTRDGGEAVTTTWRATNT